MSTQCDRCLTNLSWKIDARQNYLMTTRSTQAFSIPSFYAAYKRIVNGLGVSVAESAAVPLINLCDKCWAKAADGWTKGGAAVYANIPAKTADDGVYFRNAAPEYGKADTPDLDSVKSTIVHEMMHYLSHEHAGIQAYESGKKIHWDESVNDMLARRTYLACSKSTYKTNYGKLSDLLKLVCAKWTTTKLGFSAKKLIEAATAESAPSFAGVPKVPKVFREALTGLTPGGCLTPMRATEVQKELESWFATWHQKGESIAVPDACNMDLKDFVEGPIGTWLFTGYDDGKLEYGTPTEYSA